MQSHLNKSKLFFNSICYGSDLFIMVKYNDIIKRIGLILGPCKAKLKEKQVTVYKLY